MQKDFLVVNCDIPPTLLGVDLIWNDSSERTWHNVPDRPTDTQTEPYNFSIDDEFFCRTRFQHYFFGWNVHLHKGSNANPLLHNNLLFHRFVKYKIQLQCAYNCMWARYPRKMFVANSSNENVLRKFETSELWTSPEKITSRICIWNYHCKPAIRFRFSFCSGSCQMNLIIDEWEREALPFAISLKVSILVSQVTRSDFQPLTF